MTSSKDDCTQIDSSRFLLSSGGNAQGTRLCIKESVSGGDDELKVPTELSDCKVFYSQSVSAGYELWDDVERGQGRGGTLKREVYAQSGILLLLESEPLSLIRWMKLLPLLGDRIPCFTRINAGPQSTAFFLSWNHKSRTVPHSSARQLLAAFSGPRGSLSTYSLCSSKRPPAGWPRCEAHIWKLSLVLAQAFRSGRRVCVRYTHTLPGDPYIWPGAGQRSWRQAAWIGDSVLG